MGGIRRKAGRPSFFVRFYRMVGLFFLKWGCSYCSWFFLALTYILPVYCVCHFNLAPLDIFINIHTLFDKEHGRN